MFYAEALIHDIVSTVKVLVLVVIMRRRSTKMKNPDYEYCGKCENDTFRLVWKTKGYEFECTKCGEVTKSWEID